MKGLDSHDTDFLLLVESASLNFLKNVRETETDRREFPRALTFFRLVQQPTELAIKKLMAWGFAHTLTERFFKMWTEQSKEVTS